jgi:hypothetical protein
MNTGRFLRRVCLGAGLGAGAGALMGAAGALIAIAGLAAAEVLNHRAWMCDPRPFMLDMAGWGGLWGLLCGGPLATAATRPSRLIAGVRLGALAGFAIGAVYGYQASFMRPFFSPGEAGPVSKRLIVWSVVNHGCMAAVTGVAGGLLLAALFSMVIENRSRLTGWTRPFYGELPDGPASTVPGLYSPASGPEEAGF